MARRFSASTSAASSSSDPRATFNRKAVRFIKRNLPRAHQPMRVRSLRRGQHHKVRLRQAHFRAPAGKTRSASSELPLPERVTAHTFIPIGRASFSPIPRPTAPNPTISSDLPANLAWPHRAVPHFLLGPVASCLGSAKMIGKSPRHRNQHAQRRAPPLASRALRSHWSPRSRCCAIRDTSIAPRLPQSNASTSTCAAGAIVRAQRKAHKDICVRQFMRQTVVIRQVHHLHFGPSSRNAAASSAGGRHKREGMPGGDHQLRFRRCWPFLRSRLSHLLLTSNFRTPDPNLYPPNPAPSSPPAAEFPACPAASARYPAARHSPAGRSAAVLVTRINGTGFVV